MKEDNLLYLHVGYPKTATTTLQNNLFSNHSEIEYLRKSNIERFSHSIFYSRENSIKRNLEYYKNELTKVVENSDKKTFVYSEESFLSYSMFFRYHPDPYIRTLEPNSIARKLKSIFLDTGVFDEVKVIVTLREQKDLLKSIYAQLYNLSYKRFRCTNTFKRFCEYCFIKNIDEFVADSLLYNEVISEYEYLFGEKNIKVNLFEMLKENSKDYINDLCEFMNIDSHEANTLLSNKHENSRSGAKGYISDERTVYSVLQHYRRRYFARLKLSNKISEFLRFLNDIYIPGKNLRNLKMDENIAKIMNEMYSAGNNIISQKYSLNLEKYGYCI